MSVFAYTAKRSLLPGHTVDSVYELEARLMAADRRPAARKSEQQALSGRREALFWNSTRGFVLTIGSFAEQSTEYDAAIEFLDSVEGGEIFTYDRFAAPGAPVNPQSAVMIGTYQEQRYARRPGEGEDLMRFTFTIEIT